jgi:hypothetical protein
MGSISTAIDAHRQAYITAEQASEKTADRAVATEMDVADRLLETVPATTAELAALLRYIQVTPGMRERVVADTSYGETLFGTLERMAAAGLPPVQLTG